MAILAADMTVTDVERGAWRKALTANVPPEPPKPIAKMVPIAEAKRLLGVSRQTLAKYCRNGLLVPVKTSGGQRSRGYTEASVRSLLEHSGNCGEV